MHPMGVITCPPRFFSPKAPARDRTNAGRQVSPVTELTWRFVNRTPDLGTAAWRASAEARQRDRPGSP